jgi:hypothetical protein
VGLASHTGDLLLPFAHRFSLRVLQRIADEKEQKNIKKNNYAQ